MEGLAPKLDDNMTSAVLFLPWVQIENPIVVGDVTFHPFAEALALAGERREQLELFGSIYVDGYTIALACERREPVSRLRPTVSAKPWRWNPVAFSLGKPPSKSLRTV
jgi:hypothetical protein